MTQGKIERWHQTLKNRILLENYFLPGDLEAQIAAFVDDYNDCRYHESIDNLGGLNSEQIPIRLRWCSGRDDLRSPRLANTAACA